MEQQVLEVGQSVAEVDHEDSLGVQELFDVLVEQEDGVFEAVPLDSGRV
jgi:hypothetical protein